VAQLTAAGIPNSPLNTVEDVLNDPQTAARDIIVSVEHPVIGDLKMPGIPIKLSETPETIRLAPPLLGANQAEILAELAEREAVAP
jgi:CoA:oxalate CoA-transferase